jgi:AcrR family transcriptional regulator
VRRTQIVEAAAKVLDRRDPTEVTFEEIAEAAGVSRALVYNYFGDRGGLLAAVYVHTFDQLDEMLNESVAADATPVDRLRDIVRRYLHFANDNAAAWRLLHVTSTMDHPAVRSARRRHMEQLASAWGADGPEARIVAYAIVGMLESATLEWLLEQDVDCDTLADILFDLMWTGLSSLGSHGIQVPAARQQYHAATVR